MRVGGVRFRAWCPPHSLHPHLGIHHPLRIDVVDTWAQALASAAARITSGIPRAARYDAPPLTRVEAAARRAQRFTLEGPIAVAGATRAAPSRTPSSRTRSTCAASMPARPMPRAEDWVARTP